MGDELFGIVIVFLGFGVYFVLVLVMVVFDVVMVLLMVVFYC